MKFIVIALSLTLLVGCQRYVGGAFGSYSNADRATFTNVATQRDPQGLLLFVIAWTSGNGCISSANSSQNLISEINGHRIRPALERRAVYALQPDYSLKEIALNQEQISTLFHEMEDPEFHTTHSKLWQSEIAPHLISVEAGNGS